MKHNYIMTFFATERLEDFTTSKTDKILLVYQSRKSKAEGHFRALLRVQNDGKRNGLRNVGLLTRTELFERARRLYH
jgi:hypothetical protein